MHLIIISLLVFMVIGVLFLSRLDVVKTRTTLALAGVFVVILAILAGWGWGMIFGMPFTPLQRECELQQRRPGLRLLPALRADARTPSSSSSRCAELSPFILLGMGIDVMFILVKSFDIIVQREPWLTLPEAFSKLMSTAGLSVQVTLLASAVAFSLGALDVLASVRWFSAFACLNALFIMILMVRRSRFFLFVGRGERERETTCRG